MFLFPRVTGLAAVGLAAACSGSETPKADQPAEAASPAQTAPTSNVVNITAREYAFEAPHQIPSGVTTFHFVVAGKEPHHGIMVRLDEGKTFDDFAAALKSKGPPPAWAHLDGGVMIGDREQGSNLTMTLTPGRYALVCFIPSPDGIPHVAKGMFAPIEVTEAGTSTAAEPTPDVSLTLRDYEFDFSTPLTPGDHVIRVETAPGQPHEFVLVRLGEGVTAQQVVATEMGQHKGPRPSYTFLGGVAPMEAGRHAFIKVRLEPGNYALICFIPDAKNGKPHFMHGMMKEITVG
jgi:hypothetical protein